MDRHQEIINTWDKIAELYQSKFMDLDLYNDTYDFFCGLIEAQKPKILEIGSGPGNITRYLLQKRPDFRIEGIDTSPNMVVLAQANNPKAAFHVMDARDIDGLTTLFDGIVCGFCMPYLSEHDCVKLVEDCSHLLLDEGILYLSFVEGEKEKSGYQTNSQGDRMYFYYHPIESIADALALEYFKVQRLYHKNYLKGDGTHETHTIIIAKK